VAVLVVRVQEDEFVGDHSDLLESEGLDLGSGESFDDPALVFLFVLKDGGLDQVDHDLIRHYTVQI
jgi:hypothetical protein